MYPAPAGTGVGPKPAPPPLPTSSAPSDAWASWDPLHDCGARHSAATVGPGEANDPPGPPWSPSTAPVGPPAPTSGPAVAASAGLNGHASGSGTVPVKAPPALPGRGWTNWHSQPCLICGETKERRTSPLCDLCDT
eukprot:960212-Lingulodinium_polyedra.AAC.1